MRFQDGRRGHVFFRNAPQKYTDLESHKAMQIFRPIGEELFQIPLTNLGHVVWRWVAILKSKMADNIFTYSEFDEMITQKIKKN